jgi:hypothetical protein
VLDVKRSTAEHLARLLRDQYTAAGTRKGRRALGCFRQAVFVLRWFIDGTRMSQLACDWLCQRSAAPLVSRTRPHRLRHRGRVSGCWPHPTTCAVCAWVEPSSTGDQGVRDPQVGPKPSVGWVHFSLTRPCDNGLSASTAYRYLHDGLTVPSGPPDVCAVGARGGDTVGADDGAVEVQMRQT